MTHWGWYWKVKLNHKHKKLCGSFTVLDSFVMFKNKVLVELCRNDVIFEIPALNLQILLLDHEYLVTYNNGRYSISTEALPCHYGGLRYYFRCPECNRRMRILYCNTGKFLCRKCLNLCYYSQILRPSVRCTVIAGNIKAKLESRAGSLNRRPPWMKNKTFKTLLRKYEHCYDFHYRNACRKELLAYYPHKASLINQLF
ncbi:MAG: hypothetical protein UV38_C0002G0194 [candidate division TM6 bacterium GW2011_GWE2_42_60]|nr:MAG: hypothetical protein UV38_C0002G0194 [candidate division TM6 bacterium GW2011_GWE2_42_60]